MYQYPIGLTVFLENYYLFTYFIHKSNLISAKFRSMLPGSSNKFKFLHLLNYSLLTGIDFLYFGMLIKFEKFSTDWLGWIQYSFVNFETMQIRWSIIENSFGSSSGPTNPYILSCWSVPWTQQPISKQSNPSIFPLLQWRPKIKSSVYVIYVYDEYWYRHNSQWIDVELQH